MAIVAVSGSPIKNSNTDRIIIKMLEESGKETLFIKLSKLSFYPCRACVQLCGTTNMCGAKDELQPFIKDIRDADALILGSPIHDGQMTGWMYSFITRMWCLHHVNCLLEDKPTIFVATGLGGNPERKGSDIFGTFIREYRPKIIGEIYYQSKIAPCLRCGAATYCRVGGLWKMLGQSEEALKNFEFTPDKFRKWEDDPDTVKKIEQYGKILSEI